jgi:hypothetical protein
MIVLLYESLLVLIYYKVSYHDLYVVSVTFINILTVKHS